MKYMWEVLSLIYIVIIAITMICGVSNYLVGKIIIAFLLGLLISSTMKVISKYIRK